MKLGLLILYTLCLIEAVILTYLSHYLYGFRPRMADYQVFEIVPPMRDVIETSLPFIFMSPLMPALAMFTAWKARWPSSAKTQLLVASTVVGVMQMLFVFWFEVNLFEGDSFVGALAGRNFASIPSVAHPS